MGGNDNKDDLPSYFMAVEATKRSTTDNTNLNEINNETNDDSNQPSPALPLALSVHRFPLSQLRPLPALKPKDNQVDPGISRDNTRTTDASNSAASVRNQRLLRPCRNCSDTMAYIKRILCSPLVTLTRREKSHRERFWTLFIFFLFASLIVSGIIAATVNRAEFHENWLGCYSDQNDRDLNYTFSGNRTYLISLELKPSTCIKKCRGLNQSYAGLQFKHLCFCGNSYGRHGKVDSSECNMKCPGDSDYTCGGVWRSDIYKSFATSTIRSASQKTSTLLTVILSSILIIL